MLTLGVAQPMIADTDQARAEQVAASLSERFGNGRAAAPRDLAAAVGEADGVINATPVGMAKYPGLPMPAELLRANLWVADIVYWSSNWLSKSTMSQRS
jgi:shikimate dehydrogenase